MTPLLLSYYVGPKLTRKVLEEEVENFLQKKVEVGQSRINIFRGFGIEFKDVRILGPEGEEFFRAGAFVLRPWIQSLIFGRLRWKSIILKDPSIHLIRTSEGHINLHQRERKEAEPKKTGIPQRLRDIAGLLPSQIVIHGGRVRFTDFRVAKEPFVTEIEAIELTSQDISSAKPLSFKLSGRFTGDSKETLSISGEFTRPEGSFNPNQKEFAISLRADGLDSRRIWPYVRKAVPFEEMRGLLDLKIKHTGGLSDFHSSGEVKIRNGRLAIPSIYAKPIEPHEVVLTYDLEFDQEEINMSEISLQAPNLSVHGTLLIEKPSAVNPYISLDFTTGKNSLRDIRPFLPDKLIPKKLLPILTHPDIQGFIQVQEVRLEGSWDEISAEGLRKNPEMLSIRMTVDKGHFVFDPKLPPLRNLSGDFILKGDQVTIEGFHGQFLQTRLLDLSGSISRVFTHPRMALSYTGDLDLKGLVSLLKAKNMPKEIRKALDPLSKVSGKANFTGKFRYPFNRPKDLSYKGKIALKRVRLGIAGLLLPLTDLEGEIRFNEKEILLSNFRWRIGRSLCQGKATLRRYLRKFKTKLALSNKMHISLDVGAQEIGFDKLFANRGKGRRIQIDPKSMWVNSTVTGKVRISRGSWEGFHFKHFETGFILKRGVLRFKRFRAEAPGGFIRCRGWINLKRKRGLSFKLIPQIHHLSMTEVTPLFFNHENGPLISGTLNLDGIIAGRGDSPDSITKSLAGDLRLHAGKGLIHGLDAAKGDGLPYKQVTAQIAIQGGVASTKDLFLDSDAISMAIRGHANLNHQSLDVSIGVRPLQKMDKILSNVPLAGWLLAGRDRSILTFGYRVRGKFTELSVETRDNPMENP